MCNKKSLIEEQRRERTLESNHLDEETSQLMAMVEKRKTEIEERMSQINADSNNKKQASDEEQKSSIDQKSVKTNDIVIPKLEMAKIGSFFDNMLSSCRPNHADKIDPKSRLGKDMRSLGLTQEELDRKIE